MKRFWNSCHYLTRRLPKAGYRKGRTRMSDFIVRIDTAKLSDKQAASIAAAIQGAVLSELGDLDLAHPTGTHAAAAGGGTGSILFHPEWRGIWIRNLADLKPNVPALVVQQKQI